MSRPRFDIHDIEVCLICIHLLANGEYGDGEDTAEVCHAGMVRIWGDDLRHMVPGGEDLGFCQQSCQGCGNSDHGDRYRAHVLIPISKSENAQ